MDNATNDPPRLADFLELEANSLDKTIPIRDLLRKAFVLAGSVGESEMQAWLARELGGYDSRTPLPAYRKIQGYQAFLMVRAIPTKVLGGQTRQGMVEDAGSIEDLTRGLGPTAELAFDLKQPESFEVLDGSQLNFVAHVSELTSLLDSVRRYVATWAKSQGQMRARKTNICDEDLESGPDSVASWKDVTITFLDGHKVTVKMGGQSSVKNYTHLGMADRRNGEPNAQWRLLRAFAEDGGVLTWHSSNACRENQKRKERLAAHLKKVFGIKEEPFTMTADGKGWAANFQLSSGH